MSKHFSLYLPAFLLLLLIEPHPCAAAPPEATVLVDLDHAQAGRPGGGGGPKYVIPPSEQLTVDARQFDFTKSMSPKARPNAIQLVAGKSLYSAEWNPSGVTRLSSATLKTLNDSPPFAGFKSGDTAVIAIGEQQLDPVKKSVDLRVLWVGMIDVK